MKNNSINYDLQWYVACKAHPYTGSTTKCDLCLTEKLAIMKADPESVRNTLDELFSKCRHMNKFKLRFFKSKLLIQYISSFFLRDLWDIVCITAIKELLQCLHSRIVTELIEQSIRHFRFEVFRIHTWNKLYAVVNLHGFNT